MLFRRNKKTAPALSREESLKCLPFKGPGVLEEWQAGGLVRLSCPVPLGPTTARIARMLSRRDQNARYHTIELDELGTEVWGLVDGQRSVGAIIDEFAKRYDLLPREAEAAVTRFIHDLGRRGLVGLK